MFGEFWGGPLCSGFVILFFFFHFTSITCCKLLLFKSFQPLGEKNPQHLKNNTCFYFLYKLFCSFFSEPFCWITMNSCSKQDGEWYLPSKPNWMTTWNVISPQITEFATAAADQCCGIWHWCRGGECGCCCCCEMVMLSHCSKMCLSARPTLELKPSTSADSSPGLFSGV